ncbi:ring-opening amidohydrolase [Nonomuraea salmonea]|uniref:ring-opening amidohydrolase n=1 Tax=Nonomuraea salmonea TaxID=46181 RepID=UPI002FEA8CB5
MPDPIEVRKVPIESVTDASGLSRLIADGVIEAERVLAVIGKTEGNGGVNDYTRILADRAFRQVLAENGHPSPESVPLVWSGGTDGILSPPTPPSSPPRPTRRRPTSRGCRSASR